LGCEFPGENIGDGAVECYADSRGGGDGLESESWVAAFGAAVAGGFDGLASPACGLADLLEEKISQYIDLVMVG